MVLRNVPSTATLEEQRVEINELAVDVEALNAAALRAESDTLQTVTDRGFTTDNPIKIENNAATAFVVEDGSSNEKFVVDSVNGKINVGSSAGGASGIYLFHNNSGATPAITLDGATGSITNKGQLVTESILSSAALNNKGSVQFGTVDAYSIGHMPLNSNLAFSQTHGGSYLFYSDASTVELEIADGGVKVDGILESSLLVNTNKTPTAGEGIEMFYDSAASGGAAGSIQAYDRDGAALTRMKIKSSNWEILNDGSGTFGGDISIQNSSYLRVRATGDNASTAVQLGPDGTGSFASGALQIASTGNLSVNRTAGTNDVFNGKLNGNVTSTINADGSAVFQAGVDVRTQDGQRGFTINSSSSSQNQALKINDNGGSQVILLNHDGSATFGGVLQGDQRVVINGAGGKTGSANTLLNYAGDGSTVTASFTADGDAAFRSTITSGAADRRGQFLATCPSTVTASAADAFVATYDSTTVLQVKYNGDINLTGIIQSNINSAGNIELDSTAAFTSSPLKLYATTGNIESNNPNGDTSISIGDPTNVEGRLVLTSKLNTVEIHSRSNHPIEFLFNTTTKASIGIDGTISDSKGDLRKIPHKQESSAYTLVAADAGKAIEIQGNLTVPNSVFTAGDTITIINDTSSDKTISKGTGLSYMFNTADGTDANRTLGGRGMATIYFVNSTTCYISGSQLS